MDVGGETYHALNRANFRLRLFSVRASLKGRRKGLLTPSPPSGKHWVPKRRLGLKMKGNPIARRQLFLIASTVMGSAVYREAVLLNAQGGKLSPREFGQICCAKSREEMAGITRRLYAGRYISAREGEALIAALEADLLSGRSAEAEYNAGVERADAMTNRDSHCGGGRGGHPVAQGGLPSLGKRRA